MTIILASDHGGFELKEVIRLHLESKDIQVRHLGCHDENSVDYTDYAHQLAQAVQDTEGAFGILVCGTGIGMSIAANRHDGIRAALCTDAYTAKMSRQHNDANVLCLGGRVLGKGVATDIVDTFLQTAFEGGRHQRRIDQLSPGCK